jgi:hypothetical protein
MFLRDGYAKRGRQSAYEVEARWCPEGRRREGGLREVA